MRILGKCEQCNTIKHVFVYCGLKEGPWWCLKCISDHSGLLLFTNRLDGTFEGVPRCLQRFNPVILPIRPALVFFGEAM